MQLLYQGKRTRRKGEGGGCELPRAAIAKATQEEFFHTKTLMENQAAG